MLSVGYHNMDARKLVDLCFVGFLLNILFYGDNSHALELSEF
jgi:hypothetical protein